MGNQLGPFFKKTLLFVLFIALKNENLNKIGNVF